MPKKKFTEQDMYATTKKNLRAKYKKEDGWEIHEQDQRKEGYRPDFTLERTVDDRFLFWGSKRKEKVLVEVKAEPTVKTEHISQLNQYVRNHSGNKTEIVEKILVVPAGADTSKVKNDIEKSGITMSYLKNFQR